MDIIPTPAEARELRLLYDGNALIDLAEAAIRAWHVEDPEAAAARLRTWQHASRLTERERRGVIARFVVGPAWSGGDELGNSGPGWPLNRT